MIKLFCSTVYLALLAPYAILRIICWPISNPRVKTVDKIKYLERKGPSITIKPQTFVNRMWSKVHEEDRKIIKSNREARSTFRLGVIMALESVGTDPKMVECIAEQVELK